MDDAHHDSVNSPEHNAALKQDRKRSTTTTKDHRHHDNHPMNQKQKLISHFHVEMHTRVSFSFMTRVSRACSFSAKTSLWPKVKQQDTTHLVYTCNIHKKTCWPICRPPSISSAPLLHFSSRHLLCIPWKYDFSRRTSLTGTSLCPTATLSVPTVSWQNDCLPWDQREKGEEKKLSHFWICMSQKEWKKWGENQSHFAKPRPCASYLKQAVWEDRL